jgi:pantetheine-phosphate adenylyltransferase
MTSLPSRIAYCPGSYDPVTKGHLDIIRRAARMFEGVIVAVAEDAQKQHLFSLAERQAMVREACRGIAGVRVESFSGLLVEAARRAGAGVIVKGLRSPFDLSHEGAMAYMNRSLQPEIETIFLLASPDYTYVSSSLIKWVCEMGGDISSHVPAVVVPHLARRLAGAEPAADE